MDKICKNCEFFSPTENKCIHAYSFDNMDREPNDSCIYFFKDFNGHEQIMEEVMNAVKEYHERFGNIMEELNHKQWLYYSNKYPNMLKDNITNILNKSCSRNISFDKLYLELSKSNKDGMKYWHI